ncbi:uncharacterized protein [Physcomitrium patens]|uniref:uncharacterized protein n=1 Tax=Physcomitrium patens TaxID=3218 RepID=UPI003CCE2EAB
MSWKMSHGIRIPGGGTGLVISVLHGGAASTSAPLPCPIRVDGAGPHLIALHHSWELKPRANAITMHTLLAVLLCLLSLSLVFIVQAKEKSKTPAQYLESGAPIVILTNASLPVDIRCQQADGGSEVAEIFRTPRSTLKPFEHWSINFAPTSEDPLYCTFRSSLRKWNCDERWLIKDACLWEKSRSIMPGNKPVANSPCPRCDTRNSIGKPICVWTIQDDGIYVQQWDPEKLKDILVLKYPWREDNPMFYVPTTPSRFSVTNYLKHTVKIQCDVVSETYYLQGIDEGGQRPRWEYEIDPVVDVDSTYFTWTCSFEVLGTELRRGGVQIWSPQPEVNNWVRSPDCIDCAWRLDKQGLWLDDRSCYTDKPEWVMEHVWDSILNDSRTCAWC